MILNYQTLQIRSNDHAGRAMFGKQTYVEVKPVIVHYGV